MTGAPAAVPTVPTGVRLGLTGGLLGGAGLAACGLWLLTTAEPRPAAGWGALGAGMLFFLSSAAAVYSPRFQGRLAGWTGKAAAWLGLHGWQLAALGLSLAAAAGAHLAAGTELKMHHPVWALLAWLAAIALAVAGTWGKLPQRKQPAFRTWVLCGTLALAAFCVRAFDTTNIPLVLSGDEASLGMGAVEFLQGTRDNIFATGWFSFPALFNLLQSTPIALFGQTAPALRLPSALVGALTVGGVYLLGRRMFDERAALCAAIFLLGLHFHNNFSRLGLNNIWDGLWMVAAWGAAYTGWQQERRSAFILAGLALGLAQYFYVSTRVLILLLPLWLLICGFFDRERLKRVLPDILLMEFVFLVVFLPLGLFFWTYPDQFAAPLARVTVFGDWMKVTLESTGLPEWKILLQQFEQGFGGYVITPLKHWYEPGAALLRPVPATVFLLGLGLLALAPRQPRAWLMLLWLAAFGVMSSLSESAPAAQRYVAAAPAAALAFGFGLSDTVRRLQTLWPRLGRLATAVTLLACAVISADDLRFYYVEYTPHSNFGGANGMVAQRLADYLQNKPAGWKVFFFGTPRMGYASIASLPFLAPQVQGVDVEHEWGAADNPQPPSSGVTFVFLPEHAEDLRRVRQDYPNGVQAEERYLDGSVLFWLYEPFSLSSP